MIILTILSENKAVPPLEAEHGLSILLEVQNRKLLFDTGAGLVLPGNCRRLNLDPTDFDGIILSHGHNDHTGGLFHLPPMQVWHAPGITNAHYSLHPGKPVRQLTMPENCRERLKQCKTTVIDSFQEILPGIFLTGPIPRTSGEDCGGPFFTDPEGKAKDLIPEEQALLLKEGILIQGCCHAGIINTLEHCKKHAPEIRVHTILGGLHLLLAKEERLAQTAEYLKNTGVKTLYLFHCTGDHAIDYLKENLPEVQIHTPCADGQKLIF